MCVRVCPAVDARGSPLFAALTAATPNMTKVKAMNEYVGTAKVRPDSLTPRKFATISKTTKPTESATACRCSDGKALVMATTPETTDTATVMT